MSECIFQGLIHLTKMFSCLLVTPLLTITKGYQSQVGSRIIDQIVRSLMEEELKSLSQSWKLAYVSTILSKSSQVGNKELDLDQVKGKVVVKKRVVVPAFQMLIVKGLTKVTGHQKHVYVLVEPSPKCKNLFVPGNTTELKPGGINGRYTTSKFIWERHYFKTTHQSWHSSSCK